MSFVLYQEKRTINIFNVEMSVLFLQLKMHRSVTIFMLGTTVGLAVAFLVVGITSLASVSVHQTLKRFPGSKGVSNVEEKEQPAAKQILKRGDLEIIQPIIKPPKIRDNGASHGKTISHCV